MVSVNTFEFDAFPFHLKSNAGFRQRPIQRIWISFPFSTTGLKKSGKQFAFILLLQGRALW